MAIWRIFQSATEPYNDEMDTVSYRTETDEDIIEV